MTSVSSPAQRKPEQLTELQEGWRPPRPGKRAGRCQRKVAQIARSRASAYGCATSGRMVRKAWLARVLPHRNRRSHALQIRKVRQVVQEGLFILCASVPPFADMVRVTTPRAVNPRSLDGRLPRQTSSPSSCTPGVGGFGLLSAVRTAPAAFWVAWADSNLLRNEGCR